jgi:hypothetical protein
MSRFGVGQVLFAGGVWAVLLSAQIAAQAAPIPDFSLGGLGWTNGPAQADYVAVPGSPSPITADPAHPHVLNFAINQGKQPSFRIGDLSNPNLKQWAKDIMKKDNEEVLAGKIAFSARASCTAYGVPNYNLSGGGNIYFLQTPKQVVMIFDADAQVRRIYLNVPHSAKPKPSWYGESVGHYEGDALVVDTIGLNTKTFIDNYRTPHTEKLHVTERWKKIDDGTRLEVVMTIDDPDTFNQPWQAISRLRRVAPKDIAVLAPDTLAEQACAENNQVMIDYHIPLADKPDF